MSSLVQVSNFEAPGRFHLSLNSNNKAGLQSYIDTTQDDILNRLLGCELAALFIADLSGAVPPIPQTPIYTKIYEPFCVDSDYCGQLNSKGMVLMLQGFTFWYYMRDNKTKRTTSGAKENRAEVSDEQRLSSMGLSTFWNTALVSYNAIQKYIYNEAPEDYPTFNGELLGTVSPF